jgi:MFS transporter, BCD family, chlorophyll transporter
VTVALNLLAMWKQEARDRDRARAMEIARHPPFSAAFGRSPPPAGGPHRLIVVIGLGTFGYGMADVLLEPYGGQALGCP